MNHDVERAVAALKAKAARHQRAWDYYEGRHPLVYSSARLKQVFRRIDARFTCNWCAVVVDSTLERIRLERLALPTEPQQDTQLKRIWDGIGLSTEADDVHRATLVAGESYLLLGTDKQGHIEGYFHDARQCHLFYHPEHPKQKQMAAKWWSTAEATMLVLYYADRIERWLGPKNASAKSFVLLESGVNPWGAIPVFQFRRERSGFGELDSLFELQDAVNKLLNDLMIGSEFGVFAQRYVVSNADLGTLKNSPSEIWHLPAGDKQEETTQIGQFAPVPLSHFLEPMSELAAAIAVISRTPKHYFLRQVGDPSGEAILAMEAPLVRKAQRIMERFRPVWEEVGQFLLGLSGTPVERLAVEARFAPAESLNPRTRAELRELNVRAGFPLADYLRLEEGWPVERTLEVSANG
jgi:hypothetical protein